MLTLKRSALKLNGKLSEVKLIGLQHRKSETWPMKRGKYLKGTKGATGPK